MKKRASLIAAGVCLLLLLPFLLLPMAPMSSASESPGPGALEAERTPMETALERLNTGYDPESSGTLEAMHRIDELLTAYAEMDGDPNAVSDAVARFADGLGPENAFPEKLQTLYAVALRLAGGRTNGLVRGGGRPGGEIGPDRPTVEALFHALFTGFGMI